VTVRLTRRATVSDKSAKGLCHKSPPYDRAAAGESRATEHFIGNSIAGSCRSVASRGGTMEFFRTVRKSPAWYD
jgi:hypothetical protein